MQKSSYLKNRSITCKIKYIIKVITKGVLFKKILLFSLALFLNSWNISFFVITFELSSAISLYHNKSESKKYREIKSKI